MTDRGSPKAKNDGLDRELRAQLDAIGKEEVPERLLELARQLQELLRQRQERGDRGCD